MGYNRKIKNIIVMIALLLGYLLLADYVVEPANWGDFASFMFYTIAPVIILSFWFGSVLLNGGLKKTIGFFIGYLAFDVWSIPHIVDKTGTVLTGSLYYEGTTDIQIYHLGQALGITGMPLYYFVYLVVPAIGIVIAASLLSNKEFGELW